jgi:hypothetical protein
MTEDHTVVIRTMQNPGEEIKWADCSCGWEGPKHSSLSERNLFLKSLSDKGNHLEDVVRKRK